MGRVKEGRYGCESQKRLAGCSLSCFGYNAAATGESLRGLKLPDMTIVFAAHVAAGAFSPPNPYLGGSWSAGPRGGMPVVTPADLPAFCRVAGVIRPTADSETGFEF
jgi:hypothetical protein